MFCNAPYTLGVGKPICRFRYAAQVRIDTLSKSALLCWAVVLPLRLEKARVIEGPREDIEGITLVGFPVDLRSAFWAEVPCPLPITFRTI